MVNAPSTHDFEVVDSRTLYEGAILALRKDRVRMPGGTIATREVENIPVLWLLLLSMKR